MVNSTKIIYGLNILFILFNFVILLSNSFLNDFSIYIFLILSFTYIMLLLACKIRNYFYYIFAMFGFILSFTVTKIPFYYSILLLIIFGLSVLFYSIFLKFKGIEAEVIDSGNKYSIVEVKPDIISKIKPGYYIVEEKLEKGSKIRIKELDFFKNARIKKFTKEN